MKATVRPFFQLLIFAIAAMVPLLASAERQMLDQVIAIVDDEVILQSELEARIATIVGRLQSQGTGLPPRQLLEERVLEQLVTESIQLQMAERAGMRISDNELNETMANIARNNGMTLAQFEQQLAREGVTYREAREQIRREMLVSRVQQRQVGNRVRVTDREVANYLEARQERQGSNNEYRLAHLLIGVDNFGDEAEVAAARERAETLRQQILDGRDFREVAVAESDGPNALEGGELGWRTESQLPSLLVPVVPDLAIGVPSQVLESDSGFHLVMVLDKRGGEQKTLIEQARVRHILVRPSETVSPAAAEERIRGLYQQLRDGADFAELAREHSDDAVSGSAGGDLEWVSPGQMVPEFEQVMKNTPVGEISRPFRSQFGWHILQVTDRREKDMSGEIRNSQARQAIYRRKFEAELQNWLREIRDEAYVEFKGDFSRLSEEGEAPESTGSNGAEG
ncbi:MAG TPA: molecular chaperone SurA [Marinobacter sp.]|nr:molecular chaperone SurA [Marinobacter sp.]